MMDPTWVKESGSMDGRLELWLNETLIRSCQVDATAAYLIALEAGARAEAEANGALSLRAVKFEDHWRPLWRTPRIIDNEDACILADSGEVVIRKNGTFVKPRALIWNT
jgi:hypothetical protein